MHRILALTLPCLALAACQQPAQEPEHPAPSDRPAWDPPVDPDSRIDFEMRARPTDEAEFADYIAFLVEVAEPRTAAERATDAELKARYADALVMDALFVGAPGFPAGFSDAQYEEAIQHSIDSQYGFVSATITNGPPEDTPEVVRERMLATNAYWAEQPERYVHVRTLDDIRRAQAEGKLAVMHNFQSMRPLGEDLANIQVFYDLGLRQMNFTYNIDGPYACGGVSNDDHTDEGVSELGAAAIREMNRLGIVVDASHSSNQTAIDMARLSRKPVMLSHSNCAVYQPIGRNVSDEAIQAVAATGGVICVNFIGGFLNAEGLARPVDIAKHVQYIRNLVGAEYVGVGPDYVYNYAETLDWILRNPENFPVEMGYATPSHMGKPGEIWGVVRELEETHGWTEAEIRGFLGGNLMRVYEANFEE